jgi:site-specific recombinase XerD
MLYAHGLSVLEAVRFGTVLDRETRGSAKVGVTLRYLRKPPIGSGMPSKKIAALHLPLSSSPSDDIASMPLATFTLSYLTGNAAGDTHTARAKRLDVAKFLNFLVRYRRVSTQEALSVSAWDFSATQHFVDDALRQGESPATVARRLATLKHMGRSLAERIPGFINPARDVKSPKLQTMRPKSLSADEVALVREKATARSGIKNSFGRLRNETLIEFLLDTGLRADEVRTLRRGQLNDQLEWIENVKTKGRRFRRVYITRTTRDRLRYYLENRSYELKRSFPSLTKTVDDKLPLFISLYRAHPSEPTSFQMSPKSVWRAVRECSVDTNLHPHLLRHTYAVDLLDESRDIRLVAQALGHSDVRVTMRYTERGDEEVAAALEKTRNRRKREQGS